MEQETVLLLEGKTSSRQELKDSLAAAGYRIQTLDDFSTSDAASLRPPPHLVVAVMPLSSSRKEQIKQLLLLEPRPLFLYILTENMSKEASDALQLGADDILRSPYTWHDLRARVRLLSERRRRDNLGRPGTTSLGDLTQISLRELIDLFALRRGTATVEVQNPPYRGRLFFKEGRLFGATLNHLSGLEAFLRLLQWQEGSFTIQPSLPLPPEPLGELQDPDPLGLALRMISEWKDLLEKLPSVEQPLMVNRYRVQESEAELSDLSHHLLWQIASQRTLQGVLDDLDRDSLLALKELHRLYQKGFFSITTHSQAALPAFRSPHERPPSSAKLSPIPFEQGDAVREIRATEMKNFDQLLADAAQEAAQLLIAASQPVDEARGILERRDAYADSSWGLLDTLHTEGHTRTPSQDGPLFSTGDSFLPEEPLTSRRSPFALPPPENRPFADTFLPEETRPPSRQTKPSDPFELGDFKSLPLIEEELHPPLLLRDPVRPFSTLPDLPAIEPTPEELNKGALSLLTPLQGDDSSLQPRITTALVFQPSILPKEEIEEMLPPPPDARPPRSLNSRASGPLPTGDVASFDLASPPFSPKTLPETPRISKSPPSSPPKTEPPPTLDLDLQSLLQGESDKFVENLLTSELAPLIDEGSKTAEKTRKTDGKLASLDAGTADTGKNKPYRPGTSTSASFSLDAPAAKPIAPSPAAKPETLALAASKPETPAPAAKPATSPLYESKHESKPPPSSTLDLAPEARPVLPTAPPPPARSAILAPSPAEPFPPNDLSEPLLSLPSVPPDLRAKATSVRPPAKLGLSDEFFINDDALVRKARTRRVIRSVLMGVLLLGGTFGLLYLLFPPPTPTPPFRIVEQPRRPEPTPPRRPEPPTAPTPPTPLAVVKSEPTPDAGISSPTPPPDAGSSPSLGSSTPTPPERIAAISPERRTEPQARRIEDEPQARRIEDEPQARRIEDEPQARRTEDEPQPRRVLPPPRRTEDEPPPRRATPRTLPPRRPPPPRRIEEGSPSPSGGAVTKLLAQAQAFQRKNNFAAAEKVLRQALKQDAESVPVLSLLGQVLFEREKASQAIVFLEKAYRISPRTVKEGLMTLGSIYQERQQTAKARQMYQEYLQHNPKGRMAQDARDMIKSLSN